MHAGLAVVDEEVVDVDVVDVDVDDVEVLDVDVEEEVVVVVLVRVDESLGLQEQAEL